MMNGIALVSAPLQQVSADQGQRRTEHKLALALIDRSAKQTFEQQTLFVLHQSIIDHPSLCYRDIFICESYTHLCDGAT